MISLAALRYRSVLAVDGGPVDYIEEGQVTVFGRRLSQASARLRSSLVPTREMEIYCNADGTGVHESRMVARHIAVSEALERWAYYATVHSSRRTAYGFHVDESSNGMAAFPGLSVKPARSAAKLEAIERFCLLNWWEYKMDGMLCDTEWPGVTAIFLNPNMGAVAVILFKRSESGFHCYGHAAGLSYTDACRRAILELVRDEWAIREWMRSKKEALPKNLFERRALFFSTEEGNVLFNERISAQTRNSLPLVQIECDSEIPGPWSAYATIWRVLFRPPSEKFMGSDERYFFW